MNIIDGSYVFPAFITSPTRFVFLGFDVSIELDFVFLAFDVSIELDFVSVWGSKLASFRCGGSNLS